MYSPHLYISINPPLQHVQRTLSSPPSGLSYDFNLGNVLQHSWIVLKNRQLEKFSFVCVSLLPLKRLLFHPSFYLLHDDPVFCRWPIDAPFGKNMVIHRCMRRRISIALLRERNKVY